MREFWFPLTSILRCMVYIITPLSSEFQCHKSIVRASCSFHACTESMKAVTSYVLKSKLWSRWSTVSPLLLPVSMGDAEARVLCIGQSSRAIGKDVDRLSKLLPGIAGPAIEFLSDEIEVGSSSCSTRLMKCAHTLTEQTEFCTVCSRNAQVLQEVVLRSLLESADSSGLQKLCVMSDSYTQFSSWASSLALEYLQQESSCGKDGSYGNYSASGGGNGGVISVLAKPALGASSGLECLYSLLSSHYSLAAANCTIFRGVETSTTTLATAATPNPSNGTYGIACDLWPLLCSTDATTTTAVGSLLESTGSNQSYSTLHSYLQQSDRMGCDMQYHLWPLDICTSDNKIIDIRSSLAALLKRLLKSKNQSSSGGTKPSAVEYNPLRSLCSNVHAMHLAYCELYPEWTPSYSVISANCANFTLTDACLRNTSALPAAHAASYLKFTDMAHTEHEVSVSLNWATLGVRWPFRNANESNNGVERGRAGVNDSSSDLRSECGETESRPDTAISKGSNTSVSSGTSAKQRGTARGYSSTVHPVNALNTGCRGRHNGHQDVIDDEISVVTIGSARSGRTNTGAASKAGTMSRGQASRGLGGSSQGSVMSGASRLSQRSAATSNSRNMYSLTAAQRKEDDTNSTYGDNRTHTISSIVFDSPYGRQDCAHICASSRQLLSIGAYRHL
jgi:hypothetical protein